MSTKPADTLGERQGATSSDKMRKVLRLFLNCPPPSKGKIKPDGIDLAS